MFPERMETGGNAGWVAVGTAVGLAIGWALSRRGWTARRLAVGAAGMRVEEQVREALGSDELLSRREIEVGALADGIVELSGWVRDESESERAVAVAQRIPGVRTVLNRLDVEILEDHLAATRRRHAEGETSLRGSHWYGMGVGMGRRRQGRDTDPDRPDDRADRVSRELGAHRAVEQASEELDKLPTGLEDHTVVPAAPTDRGTVADASHRRLGNVDDGPPQAVNPASGIHENVKTGTELTLEEAGLEEELIERGLQDRS